MQHDTPPVKVASTEGLGPLPPCARVVEYNAAKGYSFEAYTAAQMLAYAAAALAAERERYKMAIEALHWMPRVTDRWNAEDVAHAEGFNAAKAAAMLALGPNV